MILIGLILVVIAIMLVERASDGAAVVGAITLAAAGFVIMISDVVVSW